jgi:hypothetical protein
MSAMTEAPGSLPEGCYVEFSDVQGCDPRPEFKNPGAVRDFKVLPTSKKQLCFYISLCATKDGIDSHQEQKWWTEVRDSSRVKSCVPCNSRSQCVVVKKSEQYMAGTSWWSKGTN